jgi:hypothetical protein
MAFDSFSPLVVDRNAIDRVALRHSAALWGNSQLAPGVAPDSYDPQDLGAHSATSIFVEMYEK